MRWQSAPPEDASELRAADAARGDIAPLLGEIARLRLQLDALTSPPKEDRETIPVCCDRLQHYLADPDNVIDYWAEPDQFLLPVRGGTRSGIVIAFCPWCGSPLPVPERKKDDKGGWSI